jgi:hypothetical protein
MQFEPFREAGRGLLLSVNAPRPGGLQTGDRLLTLAERPIDDWIGLKLPSARPYPSAAERVPYTVLRDGQTLELQVRMSRPALGELLRANWSSYLFLAYMWAIGLLVFALRPRQANAQATLLLSSLLLGTGLIFFLLLQPSDLLYGWLLPLWVWGALVLYGLFAGAAIHFALLFPSRRAILERRPQLPLLGYLGVWPLLLLAIAARWAEAATPSGRLYLTVSASSVISATAFPLSTLILVQGYRKDFNTIERRQLRWFFWAALVAVVPWQLLSVLPQLLGYRELIPQSLTSLLWLTIPTAMAIAILREGLFDIDLIINRTLVYGALTAAVLAVYFASVIMLQAAFRSIAGQESPLAIVASTLAIAALFNPLRRRIQTAVDRRFFRADYDVAQTLNAFAESVRDEVDLGRLQAMLLETVGETMQPSSLSLWVRGS